MPARFFHQSCSCGRADREAMEVEDSDIRSHEGAWVWTNWQHCHISISLEHRYGSHRKPSEKLDVLKGTTYENWKHCWAITATAQGQSLAGSRPVLERLWESWGRRNDCPGFGLQYFHEKQFTSDIQVKQGTLAWKPNIMMWKLLGQNGLGCLDCKGSARTVGLGCWLLGLGFSV